MTLPTSVTTIALKENFRRAYVQSCDFTLQRDLGLGLVAQADYVGSRSVRLTNRRDLNASVLRGGTAGRPYFAVFGCNAATTLHEPDCTSTSDSPQAQVDRRFRYGISLEPASTFSKAIGFGSNNDSGLFFQTVQALARSRALLDFDRAHNLHLSAVYEPPFGTGKQWAKSGVQSLLLGGPGPGQSWFDPRAFSPVKVVRFGNAGIINLRGAGYLNFYAGDFRNFSITERFSLKFRAEALNATNAPHFNNPGSNVANRMLKADGKVNTLGGFTEITSARSDERQVRFVLRLTF